MGEHRPRRPSHRYGLTQSPAASIEALAFNDYLDDEMRHLLAALISMTLGDVTTEQVLDFAALLRSDPEFRTFFAARPFP